MAGILPGRRLRSARDRRVALHEARVGWAKSHIYVAVREMLAEPGDRSAIVTVDLRPGRGQEEQRAIALYREILAALQDGLNTDADRFVLLVREFPERSFVVDGGQRLPPLEKITPQLA